MASINKRGKKWRVQVRAAGTYETKTFASKSEAQRWADEVEGSFKGSKTYRPKNFGEVLQKYLRTVTPKNLLLPTRLSSSTSYSRLIESITNSNTCRSDI